MVKLNAPDAQFASDTWEKIEHKIRQTDKSLASDFPDYTVGGKYRDSGPGGWTSGFWPGILWKMFLRTGEDAFRQTAQAREEAMDAVLSGYDGLHHDVGFMWLLSSVADWKITGREDSRRRGLLAASTLASRLNLRGGFIRAWPGDDRAGWAIIDCMMNINLLYWAAEITGDPRFRYVAERHADTTRAHIIRDDGSSNHIVIFDPETGEVLDRPAGQGCASGSSWSRGQAWALYGFALSYRHTRKAEYLSTAKQVAHYFIAGICDDFIPAADFRAPEEPVIKDSSAGAIAACGLIELAGLVPPAESNLYLRAALRILRALESRCTAWDDPSQQGLLTMATGAYHDAPEKQHTSFIFGDYFFVEAVSKLLEHDVDFW